MYWSTNTPFAQITKALKGGVDRFEELRRFLHFSDIEIATTVGYPNFDRLYKVRHLLSSIVSKCNRIESVEYNSVDEQVIRTKCRSILKTYNPKKPNKWG